MSRGSKKIVIEETISRENYSKVILHKPMMMFNPTSPSNQKSEKEIQLSDSDAKIRGSPGLVKRRVLEMSTSPKATTVKSTNSKLLLAPKPFSRSSPVMTATPTEPKSAKMEVVSPGSGCSSAKKPAVPPKPRHVFVKKIIHHPTKPAMGSKKSIEDQNDSGLSEEADDLFNESSLSPMRNCSFTSLSQKLDDERFDLLKRRQSYSQFEDLIEKKRELRERMLTKIMYLREERDLLMEEKVENDQLGKKIAVKLEGLAKGAELDKYRQFLEEIEQITKLMVSLTIRLSRQTKKMETGSYSKEEMQNQQKKKSRLVDQLTEAENLHRHTDRRADQVRVLLANYLSPGDLSDYDTFLVNLIRHITDLKETDQRIQLGEEQLIALNDNLISLP